MSIVMRALGEGGARQGVIRAVQQPTGDEWLISFQEITGAGEVQVWPRRAIRGAAAANDLALSMRQELADELGGGDVRVVIAPRKAKPVVKNAAGKTVATLTPASAEPGAPLEEVPEGFPWSKVLLGVGAAGAAVLAWKYLAKGRRARSRRPFRG
jgi:hypothetical protein